jgi:hypothetical protein
MNFHRLILLSDKLPQNQTKVRLKGYRLAQVVQISLLSERVQVARQFRPAHCQSGQAVALREELPISGG